MDTVTDVYGSYYQEKGREIPRESSLSPSAAKLWREMEIAAHAEVYRDGPTEATDAAVERLLADPGCSWKRSTIKSWIRQHYYK